MHFYSFIIPVYNRPQEVAELLASFRAMETGGLNYEIIIVEDGSAQTCEAEVAKYSSVLPLRYFYKKNSGPGYTRNFGMERAEGDYFIILDSDVLLPPQYLRDLNEQLHRQKLDCFGGADKAHPEFTAIQKAINFAMTSFLTTGGIRGSKKSLKKFQPRSFNMGFSKEVFSTTKGFSGSAVGEDIDLSLRIAELGFKIGFVKEAYVYHKRRVNWKSFYKQVHRFGLGRPVLNKRYPKNASFFFAFPALFCLGFVISLILLIFNIWLLFWIYCFYFLLIFVFSFLKERSFKVALNSIWAVSIQFWGYGTGYLRAVYQLKIANKTPEEAFPNLFYKP